MMMRERLPNDDAILASAVRFLIDDHELDAAAILLSCSMSVDEVEQDPEQGYSVAVITLRCPRVFYSDVREFEKYYDFPHDHPNWEEEPKNLARTQDLMAKFRSALHAVLPASVPGVRLEYRVHLIELEEDWRNQLLEAAQGRSVHNQAIGAERVVTWKNHRFRSQSEVRIAQALDATKVLFFPNCKARLGHSTRENKEPDFLVFHKGKWGILEVDGPHHTSAADDHERDRLFKHHGIRLIEHFEASECFENAAGVVKKFLYLLENA